MASILTLSYDELKTVIETNSLPEGCDLEGIDGHKDFAKLFAKRLSPKAMAQILIKDAPKSKAPRQQYESVVPPEIKERRLELKRLELEVKQQNASLRGLNRAEALSNHAEVIKRLDAITQALITAIDRLDTIEARIKLALNREA